MSLSKSKVLSFYVAFTSQTPAADGGSQFSGFQTLGKPATMTPVLKSARTHRICYALRQPHSTMRLFARNDPMTTSTLWPRFTAKVGFENAIQ